MVMGRVIIFKDYQLSCFFKFLIITGSYLLLYFLLNHFILIDDVYIWSFSN